MLNANQKKKIVDLIVNLEPEVEVLFNKFNPDEQNFIFQLIINQKSDKGFCIETNGTSKNLTTVTKFRKRMFPIKKL